MSKLHLWIVVLLAMLTGSHLYADQQSKLKVMLLSGANNHNWRETTPLLKKALEQTNRFEVVVINKAESITPDLLNDFDVIVSDFNTFTSRTAPPRDPKWSLATKKALINFVRHGKGHVAVHAGSSSFSDWTDYQKMVMGSFKIGQTSHGKQHQFPVTISNNNHPITKGMTNFTTFDELWHNTYFQDNAQVLATAFSSKKSKGSGKDEPVIVAGQFGSGRSVFLVLGHNGKAINNVGFKALLTRSTEWAATGKVTITLPPQLSNDPATLLKPISNYQPGDDRQHLKRIEQRVYQIKDDTPQRNALAGVMLQMLADKNVTTNCKQFLCKQLEVIASPTHVPELSKHLDNPALSMFVRGVLEVIPGNESTTALRQALQNSNAKTQNGLVASLGIKRDMTCVPLITPLLQSSDQPTASNAAWALGQIGGKQATDALIKAYRTNNVLLKHAVGDALLTCTILKQPALDHSTATKVLTLLSGKNSPKSLRIAATSQTLARSTNAGQAIAQALASEQSIQHQAAIFALRQNPDKQVIAKVANQMNRFDADTQLQLLAIISQQNVKASLAEVTRLITSEHDKVRLASIATLGTIGDKTTADVLVKQLKNADRTTTAKILVSLTRLSGDNGDNIDKHLTGLLQTNPHVVVIKSLVNRNVTQAVPALLGATKSQDKIIANEAVKAIGQLASVDAISPLVTLLDSDQSNTSKRTVQTALLAICSRLNQEQTQSLLLTYSKSSPTAQKALMKVLAALGSKEALVLVRQNLSSSNAELRTEAIRSLASWPNASPAADLLKVAKNSSKELDKILAIRGIASLVHKDQQMDVDQRAKLLTAAMPLANDTQTRRQLLVAATKTPSVDSLQLATDLLKDKQLSEEAALAIVQLANQLKTNPAEVKAALNQMLGSSKDKKIQKQAQHLLRKLDKPTNLAPLAKADSPDNLKPDGAGQDAHAAIDGNPNTYWDEENGKKEYRIRLTFPRQIDIGWIAITGYRQHYAAPKDFTIVTDGQVIKNITDATYTDNKLIVDLPANTQGKTLELVITGYHGPSPGIRELEVYAPIPTKTGLHWQTKNNSVALLNSNQMVWQFNYDPKFGKTYFDPLGPVDAPSLTWAMPSDHPWHYGLWFSWKYINGLNYWEENKQTHRGQGFTAIKEMNCQVNDDHSAILKLQLAYHPADKPTQPVMIEKRAITISAPAKDGSYHMDWTSTFTAGTKDVKLDRTPLPNEKGGKTYGGYAGLSVRMKNLTDRQIASATGPLKFNSQDRYRGKTSAFDYNGILQNQTLGVAIFDHPKNRNSPSPWYAIASKPMTFFSPAVICYKPFTLKAGDSFTLQYRIVVHKGRWNSAQLKTKYNLYVSSAQAK